MAALIPDFEYDIFISYRQKDNKYEGWITEFVDNLKRELEATFKEDISVYFDINPHDGLLETNDVDASLEEKLKCLVFIPILSRTYCDPKSFAWEHEFKTFIEKTAKDQFGIKVKLPNGNVASRILPVCIHDLDPDDIKLCESVMGGMLRGVEFIYKSAGVNRSLRAQEEKPHDNINKTIYRDQINKVALAIKEIILGLKAKSSGEVKEKIAHKTKSEYADEKKPAFRKKILKLINLKLLSGVLITGILIFAVILVYPKIFNQDTLEKLISSGKRISVVVFPFQNSTNVASRYGEIVQDNLTTYLSNYPEELRIQETENINEILQSNGLTNYVSIAPSLALSTAKKMDADVFISGNIIMLGNVMRIYTQLTDTRTKEVIKAFQSEGSSKEKNLLSIIDTLTFKVGNYLLISILKKNNIEFNNVTTTNSLQAYMFYLNGKNAYYNEQYGSAIGWFKKALEADTNFLWAMRFLIPSYNNYGNIVEVKKWTLKFYSKKNIMNECQKLHADVAYAGAFQTPTESIYYLKRLLQIDDQPPTRRSLGSRYFYLHQYDKAIPELEKALEMYKKWGVKPLGYDFYSFLGTSYHSTGQNKKEKQLYKKAEQDFPDNRYLTYRQAILALTEKDTITANRFIGKFISILKDLSASEAAIAVNLGNLYTDAGLLDKGERYYRKAREMEPQNVSWQSILAAFLINSDRNINEGMELIDTVLIKDPENYEFQLIKGWGLYKQGKYQEALELLQKSWDLRMKIATYNHEAFLHLQEAKKAVEGKK